MQTQATKTPPPHQPAQIELALRYAPPKMREHGLQEAHSFPLVSRGKGTATVRRPARLAWSWPEIELRTPNSFPALLLDVDTDFQSVLSVAIGSADVRVPNWIATNPATGNSHVCYTLARPVLRGDGMRVAPLQKLARVAEYYRHAYGADRGYMGVLTHNPTHAKWETSWLREEPWTLPELAEPIPKGWRTPPKPTTPEGRNVTLFRAAMRWFGRPSNWEASTDLGDVLTWCEAQFAEWYPGVIGWAGWHRNECRWIAKSVVRYCRRNLSSGQTQANFSFIQAAKGRRSGASRRKRTVERDVAIVCAAARGERQVEIAEYLGVAQSTVSRVLRRTAENMHEPKQDDQGSSL